MIRTFRRKALAELWAKGRIAKTNAKLHNCDLAEAELLGSDWTGAHLSKCKLNNAKIAGSHIHDSTIFEDTNWWTANFTSSQGIDTVLLKRIISEIGRLDEAQLQEAHFSVRAYLAEQTKNLQESSNKTSSDPH